jgi:hypothetical protein
MHAPNEEKSDDSEDSFYEELEQVFYHFRSITRKCYWEISMHKRK